MQTGAPRKRKESSAMDSFDPSIMDDEFTDHPIDNVGVGGGGGGGFFDVPVDPSSRRQREIVIDLDTGHNTYKSAEARDFSKDPVRETTYGRRIALSLMSQSWYNPSASKVKLDDVLSEDGLAASTEKLGSPSLQQAWEYFEHVTLPRYVVDLDAKDVKGMVGRCCERMSLFNRKLEKAEPGELYLQSRLYDVFFTPQSQMGDFGLGFGLYFSTLRAVAFVTFVAGLVSIPNMMYFMGSEYSNNQQDVNFFLKGTVSSFFDACVQLSTLLYMWRIDPILTLRLTDLLGYLH